MNAKSLLIGLFAIGLMITSFIIGRKSVQPTITTEIKWDTLTIEKPIPVEVEKSARSMSMCLLRRTR